MSSQNHHVSVPTMTCSGCEANIKGALSNLSGVDSIKVNLSDRTIVISGDAQIEAVIKTIAMAGYHAIELSSATE